MILPFPREFAEDAAERSVADVAQARRLLASLAPGLAAALARRRQALAPITSAGDVERIDRADAAVELAYARLALRHGSWGEDFHAYHNEHHILEIFDSRIARLMAHVGVQALGLDDWLLLGLFAACHDLRQREPAMYSAGVGSNERASIEESFRILDLTGFDRRRDAAFYTGLELTIAGSTFDARPPAQDWEYNSVDLVQSGGALASKLDAKLDKHAPGWRDDPALRHALDLALIAADLDTANVAEPFARFVETGMRLCQEREMRCHRATGDPASALPVFGFLTDGQERFFFELHRFNSDLGRTAFSGAKQANAQPLRALTMALRARMAMLGKPANGDIVIDTMRELTREFESRSLR
ncbi:MAG TPA: hypothetical protein VLF18_12705 [Tahibacter sp.]|uniref:hypothetical protein n=1 Tax=Tahibacter sp. TaxID=2056211 RepID=UPI002BEF01DE|nr:hypothetical protein [Tahibacter sp.]HSX61056.1 hypothetical protein [Tahibacter sp.]